MANINGRGADTSQSPYEYKSDYLRRYREKQVSELAASNSNENVPTAMVGYIEELRERQKKALFDMANPTIDEPYTPPQKVIANGGQSSFTPQFDEPNAIPQMDNKKAKERYKNLNYQLSAFNEIKGKTAEDYAKIDALNKEKDSLEKQLKIGVYDDDLNLLDRVQLSGQYIGESYNATPGVLAETAKQAYKDHQKYKDIEDYRNLKKALKDARNRVDTDERRGSQGYTVDAERAKANKAERDRLQAEFNAKYVTPMDMNAKPMQDMIKAMQKQEKAKEGFNNVGGFLWDTGTSIVDNAALMPMAAVPVVGPSLSSGMLGAKSAAMKAVEVGQEGRSAKEALERGLASGAIETITEKMPMEKLLDIIKTPQGKALIGTVLKQAGTEGTEEEVSYIANAIMDSAYNGTDLSDELSLADAVAAFGGGALSGGIMGAGGYAVGKGADHYNSIEKAAAEPIKYSNTDGHTKATDKINYLKENGAFTEEQRQYLLNLANERLASDGYADVTDEDIDNIIMDDLEQFDKGKIFADETVEKVKKPMPMALPQKSSRPDFYAGEDGLKRDLDPIEPEMETYYVEEYRNSEKTEPKQPILGLPQKSSRPDFYASEYGLSKDLAEPQPEEQHYLDVIPVDSDISHNDFANTVLAKANAAGKNPVDVARFNFEQAKAAIEPYLQDTIREYESFIGEGVGVNPSTNTRYSNNPQWYRDYYKNHKKAPTKADKRAIGEKEFWDDVKRGGGNFLPKELAARYMAFKDLAEKLEGLPLNTEYVNGGEAVTHKVGIKPDHKAKHGKMVMVDTRKRSSDYTSNHYADDFRAEENNPVLVQKERIKPDYKARNGKMVMVDTRKQSNAEQTENKPILDADNQSNDNSSLYGEEGKKALNSLADNSLRDEFEQYYRAGITNQAKPQLENGRMNKNQSSAAYFAGVKDAKSSKANYQKKKAVVNKKAGLAMDTAQHLPLQVRKMYDNLGKALGVRIVFDNNINGNGYYNKSNAELHLKNNLGKATDTIAIHEIIHRLRQIAPKEFDALADAVFEYRGVTDADMQEYTELYKGDGLDYYDTLEEMVCDFLGETVSIEEMVDMLPKHKTFIDKFMEVIRDFLEKIRNVQGKEIEKVKGDFEHLLDLLDTTVKAGAENANILAAQQSNKSDVNSESNKRFSLKQPIEETKDLVAVHNLNESNLNNAFDLGGFPAPSIAVVRSELGHSQFGDISLVFPKTTIDPKENAKNKIYGADAYTPTFPKAEYKIDEKRAREIEKEFAELSRKVFKGEYAGSTTINGKISGDTATQDIDSFVDELAENRTVKAAYIADKNIEIEPVYQTKKFIPGYTNNLAENVVKKMSPQKIAEKIVGIELGELLSENDINEIKQIYFELISKGKSWDEVPAFKRRMVDKIDTQEAEKILKGSFEYYNSNSSVSSDIDHYGTLDSIDKTINKEDLKQWIKEKLDGLYLSKGLYNGKDVYTNKGNRRTFDDLHYIYNLENIVKAMYADEVGKGKSLLGGNIFGAATQEFNSIEDVKSNKHLLQELPDDYNEQRMMYQRKLQNIAEKISKYPGSVNSATELLIEAVAKNKNEKDIISYIKKEGNGWLVLDKNNAKEYIDLINEIKNMPTDYFEAKPERVVGFDEVAAAIIPADTSEQTKNQLKKMGVEVVEYDGTETDRLEKLNSLEDVRFSKKVFTGEEKQKRIVENAKQAYPKLKEFRDETIYRVVNDKDFYDRIGWAYANGVLNHHDAVVFNGIIADKKAKENTPRGDGNLYYHLVNDKIVLTDENFEIPKIYTVISGENVADYYDYFVEDKNGEKRIISKIIDVWGTEETIHEDRARYFDNYKQLREKLAGKKKNDRNYGQQRNGRRNLAEDSAVEREVQSGIDDDRRSKRQPNIPKGYTERGYNESIREKTDMPDVVKDEFIDNPEIYKKLSNKTTQAKADSILQKGTEYAEKEFNRLLANMDAVAIPLGYNLSKEYISAGQQDRGVALLRAMAEKLTQAGQFSQAAVITLTKSNPESALIYLEREIDKLNADGKKTFGKKWKDFKLTDAEKAECKAIKDGDADAIEKLFKKINKRIDKEYPTTIWQKFIEGTRISMLLNPRTNMKNIVSNAFLYPLTSASGKLSAALQKAYSYYDKNYVPNQAVLIKKDSRKLAEEIWKETKDKFNTVANYKEKVGVRGMDTVVFKGTAGKRVLDSIAPGALEKINKMMGEDHTDVGVLETLRHATYFFLEAGDNKFVEKNFINRLGSYLEAQGITEINENTADIVQAGIQVAYREALKATFKDDTVLSEFLMKIKNNENPYLRAFTEMLFPFVKTPANIAMRGIDYSPVGLINTFNKALKGASTSDIIDELSKNLLGCMLIFFGALLFNKGIITGSEPTNKKHAAFLKQQGWLPYAVKWGDRYVAYDWLQPASIPIIMGATIAESIDEGKLGILDAAYKAGTASVDKWVELSPLINLKEVLGGYGSPSERVMSNIVEMPQRLIPTALGAVARTSDTTQRVTYSKGDLAKTQKDKIKSKLPIASKSLPAAYSTWGKEIKRDDSTAVAAFNQLVNPFYNKKRVSDKVDKEIEKLYDSTGDENVFPRKAQYSIRRKGQTYNLSNEEYSKYQKIMGDLSYESVKDLIEDPEYKEMTDAEKQKALKKIYDDALEKAKMEILKDKGIAWE